MQQIYIKPIKNYIKPIKTYIQPIKTYLKPTKTNIYKTYKQLYKPIKNYRFCYVLLCFAMSMCLPASLCLSLLQGMSAWVQGRWRTGGAECRVQSHCTDPLKACKT